MNFIALHGINTFSENCKHFTFIYLEKTDFFSSDDLSFNFEIVGKKMKLNEKNKINKDF